MAFCFVLSSAASHRHILSSNRLPTNLPAFLRSHEQQTPVATHTYIRYCGNAWHDAAIVRTKTAPLRTVLHCGLCWQVKFIHLTRVAVGKRFRPYDLQVNDAHVGRWGTDRSRVVAEAIPLYGPSIWAKRCLALRPLPYPTAKVASDVCM